MGVQAMFCSGRFDNNTGGAGLDILADILSNFWTVEMFLQHCHCLFDTEVSFHLTVMIFPNQIFSLS
jgi:hypothetical protein